MFGLRHMAAALCAAFVGGASFSDAAAVSLDAPGHVYTDKETPTARGGVPGAPWTLTDWRGRAVPHCGTFGADGSADLPQLPTGYYHLKSGAGDATFAVVPVPESRVFDHGSCYGIDSAQSAIADSGSFDCPWNGGDTYRTVSDLLWRSGIPHVRERMSWPHVNPRPNSLDFGHYLYNADMLRARGILISETFHSCPKWAGRLKALPADLNATFDFCAKAAAAFGDRMGDWEFWNEPDISFAPEPVWDYAAALKAAYLGFKAGRPGTVVLPGSLCQWPDTTYVRALYENDAAKFGDVFNYHTYTATASYPRMFAALRAFMERYGIGDRAVWMTECGTYLEGLSDSPGTRKGLMAHSPEQELVKAECYPKGQIALQMEGVARSYYFVFCAYNERKGAKDWGVMRRDGTVKPEYAAISAMTRELVSARLKGEVAVGDGLKVYLFEQPDGSQTVAYWSISPADTLTNMYGPVKPTPDFAKPLSLPVANGVYRISDLCGARSSVAVTNGILSLEATRFPAYVSGLSGLVASKLPHPAGKVKPYVPAADEDLSVIIRAELCTNDFEIAGEKTLAVLNGDAGGIRLHVWNMDDCAKTGRVEVAGGTLAGLPGEIVLGPRGTPPATIDCVFSPSPGSELRQNLVITGVFGGKRSSRLFLPVRLEKRFLSSCEAVPIACNNPKDWKRNTSADTFKASWDEAEQALRFDVEWKDHQHPNKWFYPVYTLKAGESLSGAKIIQFEVKSVQDKIENDFTTANLMLLFGDAAQADVACTKISYSAPIESWEKRYVDLSDIDSLADVTAFRLGANPKGSQCTFYVRNIRILKKKCR